MRDVSLVASALLIFFLFTPFLGLAPSNAVNFGSTTASYTITGELCYEGGTFFAGTPVSGTMWVQLNPGTGTVVECAYSYTIQTADTTLEAQDGTSTYVSRRGYDGNYTLFYIDLPAAAKVTVTTLRENVQATRVGVRYVQVAGQLVKAHYYCYVVQDMQSVLRFEWYFEWHSGVLLQYAKHIETNFVRVQWLTFRMTDSTLVVEGAHPVAGWFANVQEQFFAVLGAGGVIVVAGSYLIKRKARGEAG